MGVAGKYSLTDEDQESLLPASWGEFCLLVFPGPLRGQSSDKKSHLSWREAMGRGRQVTQGRAKSSQKRREWKVGGGGLCGCLASR